jgi:phage baseplate assembly protein W
MAQYIGFSTINAGLPKTTNVLPGQDGGVGGIGGPGGQQPIVFGKKFRTVDQQLVLQDLINALNIPYGQKVGQPQYGTSIWDYVFEPNTLDVQTQLQNEVRRVISLDPRLSVGYVNVYPQENGILIEVQVAVVPFNQATVLNVFFNQQTGIAAIQ